MSNKNSRPDSLIKRRTLLSNRSGFELAMSTLVIIILSIAVLVVLLITFTGGWKKLWGNAEQLTPSDLEVIKSACVNACNSEMGIDFCCRQREAVVGNNKIKINCTDYRLNVDCNIKCTDQCSANAGAI